MAVFLVFHTVGSWLAWAILRSFRNRATYLVEIDRYFVATERNRKRVKHIACLGEFLLASVLWPVIIMLYCSDAASFESTYVRVFHDRVISVFTQES